MNCRCLSSLAHPFLILKIKEIRDKKQNLSAAGPGLLRFFIPSFCESTFGHQSI